MDVWVEGERGMGWDEEDREKGGWDEWKTEAQMLR